MLFVVDRYVATVENAAQWTSVFNAMQEIMNHFQTRDQTTVSHLTLARFGYAVMPSSVTGSGSTSTDIASAARSRAQQRAAFAAIASPRISSTAPPAAVEKGDFALLIENTLGPRSIAKRCGERSATLVTSPHCIIVLLTGETSPAFGQGYQDVDNRFDVLALANAINARRLARVGSGGHSIATSIIGVPLGTSVALHR